MLGPGTMDIKGGTVLICMILDALQTLAPERYHALDFAVLLNAAEEDMAADFAHVAAGQLGAPEGCLATLVFESGKLCSSRKEATVVTGRKGRCVWKLRAAGIEGHAGNAHHTSRNAVVELARAVLDVSTLTNYNDTVTVNVGTFHGGIGVNTVPGSAEAVVEMRSLDVAAFERTALQIDDLIAGANHPYVSAERELTVPPWTDNRRTSELVEAYTEAANTAGFAVLTEERGGGSDANWLWHRWPTLDGLGPSGANAHCSRPADAAEQAARLETREYAEWSSFCTKATIGVAMLANLHTGARGA